MERNNDFNLDLLKEYVERLQAEKTDILNREQLFYQGTMLMPEIDCTLEEARQQVLSEIERDKSMLLEREQELMQIVNPIFSNGLSYNLQKEHQE